MDLSELITLHGKTIYSFCHHLAKNKADADDLYQETFLKATELCCKIDKANNPKGFLIAVAARLWKNNSRKYARRQRISPIEELNENVRNMYIVNGEKTPEDIVISKETHLLLLTVAQQLKDKLRIPLYMYYTVGMTNEEIATALKIPLGTVKSRLHRAREILKNSLEVSEHEKL